MRDEAHAEGLLYGDAKRFLIRSVLPRDGGWLDQDPRFVEAVNVVADEAAAARKAIEDSVEPGPITDRNDRAARQLQRRSTPGR
jgi:hypothetical protein